MQTLGYSPAVDENAADDSHIKAFQAQHGLENDGIVGPLTRATLLEQYMDLICADREGVPFKVVKEDFLARGEDADGQADYQGCGEFNPVLLLSRQERAEYQKSENHPMRNEVNAPNRRVLVFLFKPGTNIKPERWPCPRAKEGTSQCRKRLWSDSETRRNELLPDERRTFQKTEDTFACRFYHGLAVHSPCEAVLKLWVVRLQIDAPNQRKITLKNRRFVLSTGSTSNAPIYRGYTDDNGFIRIPVYDEVGPVDRGLIVVRRINIEKNIIGRAGGCQ